MEGRLRILLLWALEGALNRKPGWLLTSRELEQVMGPHSENLTAVSTSLELGPVTDSAMVGEWLVDPAGSHAEFHVKHFWGAITVHGSIGGITGEGALGADGVVTGQVRLDAASLTTNNKRRDDHLRSADFFSVTDHPEVVVKVTKARLSDSGTLACQGTLEAAGHNEPIDVIAEVESDGAQAVIMRAHLVVDRTHMAMTWSPLGMAARMARLTAVVRFVRS
jgi:polyisoprenoid-binding protein YceI